MKELSIKEKAEAYDYAVNKAKELILNENGVVRVDKPLFDELFPSEMEESEDEKIRRELLDHIRHSAHNTPADKFNAWVAWLEKQGNKKDNLSVDFVLGYLGIKPAYKDGNDWCILLGDNIQEGICGFGNTKEEALIAFMKELIEKQGEKSVDKLKVSDELYEHIRNTCACIDDAYSTETLADMIDYLSTAQRSAQSAFDMIEKQGEKKPAWSEEDEREIEHCIDFLNHPDMIRTTPTVVKGCKNWLKSLKPQNTWKPSEEQMTALRRMKAAIAGEGEIYKPLNSLYEDLKKLRKE